MKHATANYQCVQDMTSAQELAKLFLTCDPVDRNIIGRRLASAVLGMSPDGRYYDPHIPQVDDVIVLVPWDEPVFLFRGEHAMTIDAMRAWIAKANELGVDKRIILAVERQLRQIVIWPRKVLPTYVEETTEKKY